VALERNFAYDHRQDARHGNSIPNAKEGPIQFDEQNSESTVPLLSFARASLARCHAPPFLSHLPQWPACWIRKGRSRR